MLVIVKGRPIEIDWYIFKGANKQAEDFSQLDAGSIKVFLVGPSNKGDDQISRFNRFTYEVNVATDDNNKQYLKIDIDDTASALLDTGIYDIKVVWVKNSELHLGIREGNQHLSESRLSGIFAITADSSEDNTRLDSGVTAKKILRSFVEPTGYDGLSAYEIAVMHGYTEDEQTWAEEFTEAEDRVDYEMDETKAGDGSTTRDDEKHVPVEEWVHESWAHKVEATWQDNETTRQSQESTRQSNETTRKNNEGIGATDAECAAGSRRKNESIRVSNESTRQSQEGTRQDNETTRGQKETARQKAEGQLGDTDPDYATSRVKKELDRQSAESTRISNEEGRVAAEGSVEGQTGRAYAESVRVSNESTRQSNEGSRGTAETARQKAEGQLGSSDPDYATSRIKQELDRQSAEAARELAETARENAKISSTTIEYAVGDSGTTPPSSGWQASVPSYTTGDFLWGRTTMTFGDGTSKVLYAIGSVPDVAVSQNASTGKTTITVGSDSFDVATEPVSVSQNTDTGHTDISVGSDTTPVASVQEINDNLIENTTNYNVSFTDIDNTTYNAYPLGGLIPSGKRTLVKIISSVDVSINRIQYAYDSSSGGRSDFICSGVTLKANEPQYFEVTTTNNQQWIVLRVNATFIGTIQIIPAVLDDYKKDELVTTEADDVIATHNILTGQVTLSSSNTTLVISDNKFKQVGHTYLMEVTGDGIMQIILKLSTTSSSSSVVQTIGSYQGIDRLYIRYTPTVEFARLFFQQPEMPQSYKTINIRLVDISEYKDLSTLINAVDAIASQTVDYTDKSSSIVWNEGGYISDNGYIMNGSGYAYAELNVRKGDILIGTYANGLALNRNYVFDIITSSNNTKYYIPSQRYFMGGNNIIFFIAQNDGVIGINKRTSSSAAVNISWYSSSVYDNNQLYDDRSCVRYKGIEQEPIIKGLSHNSIVGGSLAEKHICLLHFSDIHGNVRNMENIKSYKERFTEFGINDVICTGDMCGMRFPDYKADLWDSNIYNQILLAIGNHDVYDHNGDAPSDNYDNRDYWATAQEKYVKYIAPNVANWNVVQPEGAGLNNYYPCYYYKDYDTTIGADTHTVDAVRLIVLDCMAFDAIQLSWLQSVLEDARTNGYHVIIANHFVPAQSQNDSDYDGFDTPFNSLDNGMTGSAYGYSYLPGMCDAVDTFINAGGVFICHICGHMHYDLVGTLHSHPNQIYIAVGSANCANTWQDSPRISCTKFEDLFNLISIDVTKKRMSVVRIGADFDMWMRHRGTMTIDYNSRTLISTY